MGEPATKVTAVVNVAGLAVAVMVFASALVATRVVVATPPGTVVAIGEPTVSFVLLLANVTLWPEIVFENLSRTVKVTVELLATVKLVGEAESVDSVAFGVPAVVVTDAVTFPLPMFAVKVRVCATELRKVVANRPFASVLPLLAANVSLLPALLRAMLWAEMEFEYWS